MIFDSRKKITYRTNTEALKDIGMSIKKGSMPTYVKLLNHEDEFVIWFNFVAVTDINGKMYNPSTINDYINIYNNDDSLIEEITPLDKLYNKDDGLIRIVFKKDANGFSYFAGLYICIEENSIERKTTFKRISYTFDSEKIYIIDPTDFYDDVKSSNDYDKKAFYKNFNKLNPKGCEASKPKVETKVKAELSYDEKSDEELNKEINGAENFGYKLVEPKIEKAENNTTTYKRNRQVAINAIVRNGYECEIDPSHNLFLKKDGRKYIEVHHLIPMSAQKDFEKDGISLDIEENICCLCPNCHREIHYGRNKKELIAKLLIKKKEGLNEAKLNMTVEDILKYYNV